MASSNIKFSPEYGMSVSRKIEGSKGAIETEVKRLDNLICNELCATWEGAASQKYKTEFTALKNDVMTKFVNMLGELAAQLKSISQAMEDADRQIASKIQMR